MNHQAQATYSSYIIGFGLSLLLTFAAFGLVIFDLLAGAELIAAIVALAAVQLVVQLVFFLHLGKESKPQWNLVAFISMLVILIVIVVGSLWIMKNLDYNMMHRDDADAHMMIEANKGF